MTLQISRYTGLRAYKVSFFFFLIHMIRILFYILIIFYIKYSLLCITPYINDLKRIEASEAKI